MYYADGILLFHLLDDFQSHGALAGNNVRVVVAINVRQGFLLGQAHGKLA